MSFAVKPRLRLSQFLMMTTKLGEMSDRKKTCANDGLMISGLPEKWEDISKDQRKVHPELWQSWIMQSSSEPIHNIFYQCEKVKVYHCYYHYYILNVYMNLLTVFFHFGICVVSPESTEHYTERCFTYLA